MPVTLDQLLAMRERLIREIASGKRGTPESRHKLRIVTAGIMAHEMAARNGKKAA